MNTKEIEKYKKSLHLTKEQREILTGILLGDAHLETQNKGRTYRLKIEQSLEHRDYVEHLYQVFREWVLTPPNIRPVVTKGVLTQNYRFSTLSHGAFRFYAQQFYLNGKKRVPPIINRLLTPCSIAYWFMDDGSIKSRESKAILFNTQAFSSTDVEKLINVLQTKFGLNAKKRRQREGFQIYISGYSYERLYSIFKDHMIESMLYKLPQTWRTQLPKM